MTQDLFFYGTLRHRPLLELVLGGQIPTLSEATLPDHHVTWAEGESFPMISATQGAVAEGLLAQGLSAQAVARLTFYEGGFAYDLRDVTVETAKGPVAAQVYMPRAGHWTPGAPWSLADWQAQWARPSMSAAQEVMARFGEISAQTAQHLLPFYRARAWAQDLARSGTPTDLRRAGSPDDIERIPRSEDSKPGFFRLDAFDIRHRRFDGAWSQPVPRSCFVAYDAALVLPYDPASDRVLLIEQLRYGPILRHDPNPWILEPIAGLVDAGEDPGQTARREAMEEAGLALDHIEPMAQGYGSPGYSSEHFHMFLAQCDLSRHTGGLGGLASEQEDIRSHVLSFDAAMALVDSGEITAIPLITMLLWLDRWRVRRGHVSA